MSYDVRLYYPDNSSKTARLAEAHNIGTLSGYPHTHTPATQITYNYSAYYYQVLDRQHGLYWLNGKIAEQTISKLCAAVAALGVAKEVTSSYVWKTPSASDARVRSGLVSLPAEFRDAHGLTKPVCELTPDQLSFVVSMDLVLPRGAYWLATPGNAGYVLSVLLSWAEELKDAVWEVY